MENALLISLRLLVPLSILRWPLLGIIIAINLDLNDWYSYVFQNTIDYENYQIWDKFLDIYYISLAAFTSRFWKDNIARKISIISLIYRAVGVVIFMATGNRIFLFLFPNFFENFFVFYLVYRKLFGKDQIFTSIKTGVILLVGLLIPNLIQEYLSHVAKFTPLEIIDVRNYFPLLNAVFPKNLDLSFWLFILIYIGIYAMILFTYGKTASKTNLRG